MSNTTTADRENGGPGRERTVVVSFQSELDFPVDPDWLASVNLAPPAGWLKWSTNWEVVSLVVGANGGLATVATIRQTFRETDIGPPPVVCGPSDPPAAV